MDPLDVKILQALRRDGRISNVALAERVGLSPSACLRRVQELERSGIIRGYRVVTDPERMGRGLAVYVMVGLSSHNKRAQEGFEHAMAAAPEVVECHNIAGSFEYILRVETADLAAYKRFHTEVLGTQSHVNAINSHIVMDSSKDERAT
ncbi:Lrp/AsnC family transcriptional regulator [Paracoccus sp. PARArs4]|uniref:Lrp/AsnC family transcriptional regulator n=1 Tax=Paracoccus sp. PARArs4 TaxID=2853442 RepID=UPI0024A62F6B|nr:Lrp/AsnC family transcriptional regulator [Paracoccus sp. PARArs4]